MNQAPIRLVSAGWDRELTAAIHADPSAIRIICPFIKKGALEYLLSHRSGGVQVITRFNLDDFANGVSDVEAPRMLLDDGASVRGVQNLHAKLFDVHQRLPVQSGADAQTRPIDPGGHRTPPVVAAIPPG